ncbi:MAG: arginine deiminase-related protein [Pseudomonadota bacterium]
MKRPSHFLMSPPDYLGMPEAGDEPANDFSRRNHESYTRDPAAFIVTAQDQWTALRDTLLQTGALISYLPPLPGAIDGAFTADASVTLWRDGHPHVILSQFANVPRQVETTHRRAGLTALWGDKMRVANAAFACEGSGDILYDPHRGCLWAGYTVDPSRAGGRTDHRAHAELATFFDMPVTSLAVKRPFFHLDTCFSPLPNGHVMVWPEGLQPQSWDVVKTMIPPAQMIVVDKEDAYALACNIIAATPDTLVTSLISDTLRQALEKCGYTVLPVDVGQFIQCGGGVHCLTNPLHLGDNA